MFKKKKLHIYNSLDALKILTFWAILKDKNVFLLDFDYFDGKKYKPQQIEDIKNTWSRLYDEYFVLRDDKKSETDLNKGFEKLKVSSQILDIKNNIDFLIRLKDFKTYLPKEDFLKHEQGRYYKITEAYPRIKLKMFEGIDYNLEVLNRVLKSKQNTYNLYHKKIDKKIKDEIKKVHNVYDDVANMEEWIGKDHIPIEDLVVTKWLAYERIRNIKIKNNEQNGR